MKLIELHILQSYPVSCLNRDDLGAPKSAIFGGVNRSRISSQCLKRAIREYAKTTFPSARFTGQRTKLIVSPLQDILTNHGMEKEDALKYAIAFAETLAEVDIKQTIPEVTTLIFLAPGDLDAIGKEIFDAVNDKRCVLKATEPKKNEKKKTDKEKNPFLKRLAKKQLSSSITDAADIAIFGRFVASHSSLKLDGAAMFSHALSTHSSDNELDFFVAVDDCKTKEMDQGAGMLGSLEFVSATYYRYAALNLDVLNDEEHLGNLSSEERKMVVDAFIRSTLLAVSTARKNSMNAHTLPAYVLGIVKDKGQPVQLINAFENPVPLRENLLENSIERLKKHHADLYKTWDITPQLEIAMPENDLNTFCKEILQHVQ